MIDIEVNRRFKKLIDEGYKVSPLEFSKKYFDTKAVKTYNIISGRNGLSNKMLEDILKAYPEISKTWILTGEGDMFKTENYNRDISELHSKEPTEPYITSPAGEMHPPNNTIWATLMKLVESNTTLIESNKALVEAQTMLAEAHKILVDTNAKLTNQIESMREPGLPVTTGREKKKVG